MFRCIVLSGVLALLFTVQPVFSSEKAVQDFVLARKANAGQLSPMSEPVLGKAVPRQSFFSLRFRQYPVGIAPPEGFSASNVLSVDAAGKVILIPSNKDLQAFAKGAMQASDEEAGKLAVRAWLLLSSEIVQDGFYKFQVIDESLKVNREGDKLTASGRLVVIQGGNGEIAVKLTFDAAGRLTDIQETQKIREGPRPICQASKLLDPDPLVRTICEADLLIMGRAARDYMQEQRAKASPALKAEIDRVWQRIERNER